RTAADALCSLSGFGTDTLARIYRILSRDTPGWDVAAMGEPQLGWYWTLQNQIRYQCAWALLSRAVRPGSPDGMEFTLKAALADPTGYVPALACEALERLGTPSSLRMAVRYLKRHRWDAMNHQMSEEGVISRKHRLAQMRDAQDD
ncbi:MAG: hypothetical protein AAF525_16965, partial [Pseudomonadota bacterium]